MKCENCEKEHDGAYGSGRFCRQACSRSFATMAKRKQINEKVSRKIKKQRPKRVLSKICPLCGESFEVHFKRRSKVCCSRQCSDFWRFDTRNPDSARHFANARAAGKKSAQVQSASRRSKNETHFAKLCQEQFNDVLTNEPMFNGWDTDVVIPKYKIAISWNGKWHYEQIMSGNSLVKIQNRDKIKSQEIEKAGYHHYVIKDMGIENPDFVLREWKKFVDFVSSHRSDTTFYAPLD